MSNTYGGDWSKYLLMVNWFSKFIYHKFYHRLSGRSLEHWLAGDNASKFCEAIYNYVKFNNGSIAIPQLNHLTLDTFRTLGFIDCMQLAMCQPGSGPISSDDERNEDAWEQQRAFFT